MEQRSQQPVSTGVQVAYVARGAGDCALLQQGRVPVDHVVRMDSNATSCRLSGVDLSDASLRRAQLVNADLRGAKLARAFESLEFMLSFDIYVNETTRHADIIIPGPSYAEHSDFAAVTPYESCRKYIKWAPPIFAPGPPCAVNVPVN